MKEKQEKLTIAIQQIKNEEVLDYLLGFCISFIKTYDDPQMQSSFQE